MFWYIKLFNATEVWQKNMVAMGKCVICMWHIIMKYEVIDKLDDVCKLDFPHHSKPNWLHKQAKVSEL